MTDALAKPGDPVWSAEFDRLHEVIAELRAQRDAALALTDFIEDEMAVYDRGDIAETPHEREYAAKYADVPWLDISRLGELSDALRAALGVQPEPDKGDSK